MSILNHQLDKEFQLCMPKNDFYSLEKIIGFGSKNNFSISFSKENGLVSWIAGPYIILYDILLDKQVSFIKNPNNKIISCLSFNEKGTSLVTGEGNCKNGEIRLYDIYYETNSKNVKINSILNYKVHKYGIDKLLFFRNDSYILSIGNNEDKTMNIMDLENKQIIFTSRFNRPILACDTYNNFMILCGNGFIKKYDYEQFFLERKEEETINKNLMKKSLIELSKLKGESFISVNIDKSNKNSKEKKIFFMTYNCYLVEMISSSDKLNRWVNLKSSIGTSLIMWNNYLGCGCGDGIYRIFTTELGYVCTLKPPPPLGKLNNDNEDSIHKNNEIYPDILTSLYNSFHNLLLVVYSDKTLIIYDINNPKSVQIKRSKIFHSGGIKCMDYFWDKESNEINIVTCSDDKTVILWNIPSNELIPEYNNNESHNHIIYSKYIKHIFYFQNEFKNFKIKEEEILSKNIFYQNQNKYENEEDYNLTSIKFSPCGKYIVIGDILGNILIYSLITFKEINKIEAHNGDIMSIDMINDEVSHKLYLTSGSSDTYISLIDMSEGLSTNSNISDKTIMEQMSSPVITVILCNDRNKNLKLVVGEQNSSITFFQIVNDSLQTLQKYCEENLKTYCLYYSPSIKKIISGHNGKISIWKTSTNIAHKHFQVSKGDKMLDNFRIASDESGLICATSNDDKMIRIRALHDGKLLSKIQISESITSMYFILEDNYLIATSIEGYIYFFKLNQNLIKKFKKDNELINSTEERNIINNKLKLLQKFMENDISLSKNDKVKNLLDKFQQSEEATIEELSILDNFIKEGKQNSKDAYQEEEKDDIISLKEEKPNNDDDQENQNMFDVNKNNNKFEFMNKSNIFEKGLKERISVENLIMKKNLGRISLTDTFNKKRTSFKKDEDKNGEKEKINKLNKVDVIDEKKKEENINLNHENKFSNININEEIENNNIRQKNDDIKEVITDNISNFKEKIIENTQTELSETQLNNLIITKTSYTVSSKINNKFKFSNNNFGIFHEQNFSINQKINKTKIFKKSNVENIIINKNISPKDSLIKQIDNKMIDQIKNKEDLKEIEKHVEILLSKIKSKIGKEENDFIMNKMAEKYSKLILAKIDKKK